MKSKEFTKTWNLRFAVILVIGISFIQMTYARQTLQNENKTIELTGNYSDWENGTRSITSIPITAYTDGYNIYIQNTNPNCDITVTISNTNTGEKVNEQTVPKSETAYIVISIENLPFGEYLLGLSNPQGGYLYGYVTKQ